jgi:parvulin-like peptidyl-prolyl isomerase
MTRTPKLVALALALLAIGTSACGRYLEAGAAVVDGQEITRKQLEDRVASVSRGQPAQGGADAATTRRVLLQLIQDTLVSREAERRGITIGEADIAAQIKGIRDRFQSEQEFQQALAQEGLDLEGLRDRIRNQAAIQKIQEGFAAEIKVTDAEIKQAYGDGSRFEELRVSHILFATPQGTDPAPKLKKARETLARIRAGADFAAVAKQVSEDPGSKPQGGDLGQPITRTSQIVPEFIEAAFKMKAGQVSEPVKSQFGYHLIKVTSRKKPTLAQKTEEIKNGISQSRAQEKFQGFISDLVKRANVVVNPRYGDFDPATLNIVDHEFFVPASPEPEPGGIPGLSLPPQG